MPSFIAAFLSLVELSKVLIEAMCLVLLSTLVVIRKRRNQRLLLL
jgi:hypothetical protein